MKVLVTGATGFIGFNLIKTLKQSDYEIFCLVRKTSDIAKLKQLKVKLIYGDITTIESLYPATTGMDYIYHLAIATSPRTISSYYEVNSKGTKNLLETSLKRNPNIKKFIYVSSLAAAGYSPDGKPLQETDSPHPVTHYGKSKLEAEKTVLSYKDKFPVVILRPPTVYGQGNMFFVYLSYLARLGIKLTWEGYTSLCHINDFIDGLVLAGESKKSQSQTYFICDGNIYSWEQIFNAIALPLDRKPVTIPIPHIFIHLASYICSPLSIVLKKPSFGNKLIELKHLYWLCDPTKIKTELNFESRSNILQEINTPAKIF